MQKIKLFVQSLFLCRFGRYLVRHNVGIRRAIHLYEWPHDSFGRFSLPEFLKIIIELVYPDKFIHCCQMRVLVCITYGMIHCTFEYAPYFLYGFRYGCPMGYHRTIMSRSAKNFSASLDVCHDALSSIRTILPTSLYTLSICSRKEGVLTVWQ